jgi:hypothetical protein
MPVNYLRPRSRPLFHVCESRPRCKPFSVPRIIQALFNQNVNFYDIEIFRVGKRRARLDTTAGTPASGAAPLHGP